MTVDELKALVDDDSALIIDIRVGRAFTEAHLPGTLSAPFRQTGWAGPVAQWVKREAPTAKIGIFADNAVVAKAAADALSQQELEVYLTWDSGLQLWIEAGHPVVSVRALTVDELSKQQDQWTVIDVREPYELRSGVIPGAAAIPLASLEQKLPELPKGQSYAIVCASGNRSQSAAAFMAEQGYQVANVVGGMSLWLGAGHPTERR